MFEKNNIVIELDERYFNQNDLRSAVVQALINQGKECEIIGIDFLLVDGKKYTLSERNVPVMFGPPVQQAILKEIK